MNILRINGTWITREAVDQECVRLKRAERKPPEKAISEAQFRGMAEHAVICRELLSQAVDVQPLRPAIDELVKKTLHTDGCRPAYDSAHLNRQIEEHHRIRAAVQSLTPEFVERGEVEFAHFHEENRDRFTSSESVGAAHIVGL